MIKVREKTNILLEAVEYEIVSKDILIRDLLMFLSESDVCLFIEQHDYETILGIEEEE